MQRPFYSCLYRSCGGPVLVSDETGVSVKKPLLTPCVKPVLAGPPVAPSLRVADIRNAIVDMGIEAARIRRGADDLLHQRFIRVAKSQWSSFCMADSTGKELTYGKNADCVNASCAAHPEKVPR